MERKRLGPAGAPCPHPSPQINALTSPGQLKGETNMIKRPKKKKKRKRTRTSFLYTNSKFYSQYGTEAGSRGQRKQAERGRQGEGKRTWKETERVEEEARASAREPEARWTPGPRAQPPSDPGPSVMGTRSEIRPSPAPPGGSGPTPQVVANVLNISIESFISACKRSPRASSLWERLSSDISVVHQGALARELARSASPSPL
ncbi:uncharacterized protein LOC124241572 [Equus quagga]|uniref:uncharacterized protein LOC124241572 n=1 Tax=Equus quagga TaxID=89248 RepID=UPI001EE2653E|nr:uncharacterized protein LOC124241572 [Equus quagga]XP_046521405.1 uncharacterized protein LOC124241572 [Equus quagga]